MVFRCPSCNEPLALAPEDEGKSTVRCPHCARVVIVHDAPPTVDPASDPDTAPFLETLSAAEEPTQIGVATPTLSLPAGKRVSVAILSGPRKGEVIVLQRPRLMFGRAGAGADLEVPDPDVSRRHAALECHGPRIVLRDLDSRNGTFVGGERVGQRQLEDRSEFRLGGTTFLLLVADS
jgi:hypothetical protein